MPVIGILALQGGYAAHAHILNRLGFAVQEVRCADDLNCIDGLVLPGGESTTHLKLIERFDLATALNQYMAKEHPVFATCAGMILSAKKVEGPHQESFGWIDIDVIRNGWGRQVYSGEAEADPESVHPDLAGDPLPLTLIRAPRITRTGSQVEILARLNDEAVLVREGHITAATFHPELTTDSRIHQAVFGHLS